MKKESRDKFLRDFSAYFESLHKCHRAYAQSKRKKIRGKHSVLLLCEDWGTVHKQLDFFQAYHFSLKVLEEARVEQKIRKPENQTQDMPESFFQVLPEWNNGHLSTEKAAGLCGVTSHIFQNRAFEHNRRQNLQDEALRKSICLDWLKGRASLAVTERRLGLPNGQLLFFVLQKDFQQDYLPDGVLEAFANWSQGNMNKWQAAKHCAMTIHEFNRCLSTFGKPMIVFLRTEPGNTFFEQAARLYQQGVVTMASAAELCDTQPVRFMQRLVAEGKHHVDRKWFMPAAQAFPKGFGPAYRSFMAGALSEEEAAKACSLTLKVFREWVRKLAHGEDFVKARKDFDRKLQSWQNGEITKTQLLRDLRISRLRFKAICEQENIVCERPKGSKQTKTT
ncbi:MAG: hypothetical protein K6F46_01975 [Desulfovibrio sp.]|nr:hypothetical protein [Desulfovibrio sp.]